MNERPRRVLAFGPYRLDAAERLLFRGNEELVLSPKAFETLRILVESHGHIVTKDELMRRVWPDAVVEENNLTQSISKLRRLFEQTNHAAWIQTLPRRGYRFSAPVEEIGTSEADVVVGHRTSVGGVADEEFDDCSESTAAVVSAAESPSVHGPPSQSVLSPPRVGMLAALAIATAAIALVGQTARDRDLPRGLMVNPVTRTGRSVLAAIAPDGRNVAYTAERGGLESMRLHQVARGSDIEIVPPAPIDHWGLTVAPNGEDVYYVAWAPNERHARLFSVPLLGGAPTLLLDEVGAAPIGFSPDGSRMAYVIERGSTSESRLMVSDVGGGDATSLYMAVPEDMLGSRSTGPAWSPDGSAIAVVAASRASSGRHQRVIIVDPATSRATELHAGPWYGTSALAWLPNGSGLIMSAREHPWAPRQLWIVARSDGRVRRLTNDLNDYNSVSLTADGDTMSVVQAQTVSELVVRDANGGEREIASQVGDQTGSEGFAWTPDGHIVYGVRSATGVDLHLFAPDRSSRALTVHAGTNIHPTVSRDGRHVVFASDRSGTLCLWTLNLLDRSVKQLTSGPDQVRPAYSPDGQWVAFQQGHGPVKNTVWRVALAGDAPVPLTRTMSLRPIVSPDGSRLAYFAMDGDIWSIAVISSEDGTPLARYAFPPAGSRVMRWMPGGNALAYVDDHDEVSNLMLQPLDGAPPRLLSSFRRGMITAFDWSPDGRQLAYLRVTRTTDVVTMRGLQAVSRQ